MQKQLTRSSTNRIIGGVCGGLAEYFNFDVTLVRIVFLLFALFAGGGVFFYFLLWIIMPEDKLIGIAPDQQIKFAFDDMLATGKNLVNKFVGLFKSKN